MLTLLSVCRAAGVCVLWSPPAAGSWGAGEKGTSVQARGASSVRFTDRGFFRCEQKQSACPNTRARPSEMPILTRATGALFDPATAPEAAAQLEADFAGAWTRNEAALLGGPGGEPAWPPPGAALGGAATELAAALVFGAVSGVGRAAGVAEG